MKPKVKGIVARGLRWSGLMLVPVVAAGTLAAQTGAAYAAVASQHGSSRHLYVSPSGKPGATDYSCGTAAYQTIGSAIKAAPAGGTVVVCAGTYHEQVVLSKSLSLVGQDATIDETGVTPGLQLDVPNTGEETIYAGVVILTSYVRFTGFTVENAVGEGILAMGGLHGEIGHISISDSTVTGNDQGFGGTTYYECSPDTLGGDCGEAVHFMGVAYSQITDSNVSDNAGGIYLTDDTGPTHNNLVAHNIVSGNTNDCGINLPGHNPDAISAAGKLQPKVAGVYDNAIVDNTITGNGVAGEGAGVLFAAPLSGTAAYDNLVEGNYFADNGLAGVTFHAHLLSPGGYQDLSGDNIIGNTFATNNVDGDTLDYPAAPEQDLVTTGVLVFSATAPITMVIAGNHVSNNQIGIWLSKTVTASGLTSNTFQNVATPISSGN
jgi:nitrous oxidase accessory protein NosD